MKQKHRRRVAPRFEQQAQSASALVAQSEQLLGDLSEGKLAGNESSELRAEVAELLRQHIALKEPLQATQAEYAKVQAQNAQVEREKADYAKRNAQLERERDKLVQQVEYLKRMMWWRHRLAQSEKKRPVEDAPLRTGFPSIWGASGTVPRPPSLRDPVEPGSRKHTRAWACRSRAAP